MKLLINLGLFFLVYVPTTAVLGLLSAAFQTPGMARNLGYELFLWWVIVVQLLLPTLLMFLLMLLLARGLRRVVAPDWRRATAIGLMTSLPLAQAALWGGQAWSFMWLWVAVLPAWLLGAMVRIQDPDRQAQ